MTNYEKDEIVKNRLMSIIAKSSSSIADTIEFEFNNCVNWNVDTARNFLTVEFIYKTVYDKGESISYDDVAKYIYHLSKLNFTIKDFKIKDVLVLGYFADLDIRAILYNLYRDKQNKMTRALYAISTFVGFSANVMDKSYFHELAKKKSTDYVDIWIKFAMFIYNSHKKDIDFYIKFNPR